VTGGRRGEAATADRRAHDRIALVQDERGGVTVVLDGSPQSHVQLDDPELLAFEYVQHLGLVLDTLPPGAIAVTHVGGGGLSLPRYVNQVRPGSPQIVLEPDAALTELVRRELPLARQHRIRVRPVDGLTGVGQLADGSADVVVLDAYAEGQVPAELTTTAHLADVARVLRPHGLVLLNLADEPGLRYVARVLASLGATGLFGEIALVATHEVLKGKRFGNSVAVAGRRAVNIGEIRRRVARAPFPTAVRSGAELRRLTVGARPFTDVDAAPSPPPPDARGWRLR